MYVVLKQCCKYKYFNSFLHKFFAGIYYRIEEQNPRPSHRPGTKTLSKRTRTRQNEPSGHTKGRFLCPDGGRNRPEIW